MESIRGFCKNFKSWRCLLFLFFIEPQSVWAENVCYDATGAYYDGTTAGECSGSTPQGLQTIDNESNALAPKGTYSYDSSGAHGHSDSLTGNTVTVNGGTLRDVYGAANFDNNSTAVTDNQVIVNGGTVNYRVYGGYAQIHEGMAIVTNNDVTINGGRIDWSVYGGGGYSNNGTATVTGNHVTLSGDVHVSDYVYGGRASSIDGTATLTVTDNHATLSGDVHIHIEYSVYGGRIEIEDGTATVMANHATLSGDVYIGSGVYGGRVSSYNGGTATVTGNHATLSGDVQIDENVYGGRATNYNGGAATVTGNHATLSGDVHIDENVYGGLATSDNGTATATGNHATLSGNVQIDENVYGGRATSEDGTATATGNHATLSGNVQIDENVYGGRATSDNGTATATGNHATLSGDFQIRDVYGGRATSDNSTATASGNHATLSGDVHIDENVYGGRATSDNSTATATGNHVTLSGNVQIRENVYGGWAKSENDIATATGNHVTLSGTPVFDAASALYGGSDGSPGAGSSNLFTGNTLNLHSPIRVNGVYNFENLNFYLPATLKNGGMLTISTGGTADLTSRSGNSSVVHVEIDKEHPLLKVGDTIILIDATSKDSEVISNDLLNTTDKTEVKATLAYELKIALEDDKNKIHRKLLAIVTRVEVPSEAKAFSESRLATSALLDQGSDLLALRGFNEAAIATRNPDNLTFGLIEGAKQRYNTGSHIKSDSFSLLAGVAVGHDASAGRATVGAFFEMGRGSYTTHNSFANSPDVQGSGDNRYIGGGLLGRFELRAAKRDSTYLEAAVRGGNTYNKYNKYKGLENLDAYYKEVSSSYQGAHLGIGQRFQRWNSERMELYAQYLWTRQAKGKVRLSTDDEIAFDAVQSSRSRIGGRYTWTLKGHAWRLKGSSTARLYVGAAWEREFDGKAEARETANDLEIETPTLRGNTGIAEAGVILEPSENHPLVLNFGIQGYGGKREGVALNLHAVYRF